MELREVDPHEWHIVFGIFGNMNISTVLDTLERDIIKNKENERNSILATPYFYAWLSIYCDHFTNGLFYTHYRLFGKKSIFKDKISFVIKELKDHHKKNPSLLENKGFRLDNVMKNVCEIIETRHSFRHGSIPNLIREIDPSTELEIKKILCPSNFNETLNKIKIVNAFLETIKVPTIAGVYKKSEK